MDEKLKQAFEVANYMTTLADQKRILLEEFNQNSLHFFNGGCFLANRELVTFLKTLIDLGKESAVVVDNNNTPIDISNLKSFLDDILDVYTTATNSYHNKHQKLKSSRSVESLVNI